MSKLITAKDGTKRWFNSKGELHRLDGPAAVDLDGSTHWYVNGKLHRVDGPARELVGYSRSWWLQGKRHRLDGPARETTEGHVEWYVDDIEVTEAEYPQAVLLYKCKMVLES
jgi:hypothetical protein